MGKKTKVLFLTILILLSSVNIANAISITGNSKVDWLVERGYITGDSKGFRLYDKITRAETTKMVVEASGLGEYVESFKYLASNFDDVNKNHWANGYINTAFINQLVNGYPNGTFGPSKDITYAEVIKILVTVKGDIPTNTDTYTGSLWAIPYIVQAEVLGITEGVGISNFYVPATREKVFEMVFNTMFEEEPLTLEKYNGIIMENHRVARLDDDEISFIVFEDLNKTSDIKPRYKKNDKVKLTLPKDIEDVEYLMGKVVDITVDNNNVITDVKLDKSYSYFEGPILAYEDEVYIGVNGEYYDIDYDLQVYHNDVSYRYDRYVDRLGNYDEDDNITFIAEFANVTTKKGEVYYLDSFTFSDIAPVEGVVRKDDEIVIYDDSDDAGLKNIYINNAISYTYEWGFETIEIRDIREGDVLHIYDKNKAIVRKDSEKSGYFADLFEYDVEYYFAEVGKDTYQVRTTKEKRPVYSKDGINFKTLYAEDLDGDLIDLIGSDVTYLLDMNGHIQAIIGK
ncbi:S-layer homology domain-containing protein [Tissierella sp. Yu-01]|uniref:S-layer homology domain-containing protein n=1 Tax=Tissierella sp. Yu-01 TaxID=3035694 RepID=UPI00240D71E9|nr:S-layer homology domain-containing protein [Tissierella sp. Yu-01]WFA08529.1 S-layer homology domain-containing protein [Tissierella sp. Yu-01]